MQDHFRAIVFFCSHFHFGLRFNFGDGLHMLFLNRLCDGLAHSLCDRCILLQRWHHGIDACGDDGDADLAFKFGIEGRPENDICIRVDLAAHLIGGLVEFKQRHVIAAGNIDQHALGAAHRNIVEQRVVDGQLGSFESAVFAFGFAHAHHGCAHAAHDRADVGEIEIDQAGHDHQIGNASDTGIQHIICHAEGFGEGRTVIRDAEKVLVRHDDHRVDVFLDASEAFFRKGHAARAFKTERLGDHGDGQNVHFLRGPRNHRGCAGSGSAAHASGDEDHVGAFEALADLIHGFFGGFRANVRAGACAKARGRFRAELDAVFRFGTGKGLSVSVGNDKLDTLQVCLDHVVDGIASGTANTKDQDPGLEFMCHSSSSPYRHKPC